MFTMQLASSVSVSSAHRLASLQARRTQRSSRSSRAATTVVRAMAVDKSKVNKVVLAYSGGLDTSVILKWLQDEYDCEVVTFTADLGQGEELEPARKKAEAAGVKEIFIDDLREEFVRDYVWPMFRANATYEGIYLLGTSIARPLIAKSQIEIAKQVGADAVSHGATGKGNDQVRFELGYYALKPDIQVIAPWREWDLNSRTRLISYAESKGLEVPVGKRGEAPYSMDANLLHISYEGLALEDPWVEAEEDIYTRSVSPMDAPDEPEYVEIEFKEGDPVAINGVNLSPAALLTELNRLGGKHGIGRIDIVESRFVGMKSRGVYVSLSLLFPPSCCFTLTHTVISHSLIPSFPHSLTLTPAIGEFAGTRPPVVRYCCKHIAPSRASALIAERCTSRTSSRLAMRSSSTMDSGSHRRGRPFWLQSP